MPDCAAVPWSAIWELAPWMRRTERGHLEFMSPSKRRLLGGAVAALALLAGGPVAAQALKWDPVVGAEAYRLYWSASPTSWPSCQYVQTTSTQSAEVAPTPAPGKVTFYDVVAVAPSVYRYGMWKHGQLVACTGPAESSTTEEQPPPPPRIEVVPDAKEPPPPPRFETPPNPK
jgi:hypothetical protein